MEVYGVTGGQFGVNGAPGGYQEVKGDNKWVPEGLGGLLERHKGSRGKARGSLRVKGGNQGVMEAI